MRFYRGLKDHRVMRDATALLNRVAAAARPRAPSDGAPSPGPDDARKRFRALVFDEILKPNERWRVLATSVDAGVPDPIEHPDLLAYGAALEKAAEKFEFTENCTRDQFLTANERRVCELSSSLGDTIAAVQQKVQTFAADMKLPPSGPYHALRLLALYCTTSPDRRGQIFASLGYDVEKRLSLITELLSYMERGFARGEALEYLRRRGGIPADLAQRALARHVLGDGYSSCEESAARFVQAMRAVYVPDSVIALSWADAGFDLRLVEEALAVDQT